MDATDRPMFRLQILGGFQLYRSSQLVEFPTRKHACLLAYLAYTVPVPQPRERLAALLWGSSVDERARHNLRQALSRIRQALGPDVIVNEAEAITLAPGVLDCDAVALDRLLRVNSANSIAAAVDLYGGPLLADVFVNEDGWNDWLIGEREKFSEKAIGAMVQQGMGELTAGRADAALRLGLRATSINKFREDAHRLVLRSLAAIGRTAEVKKQFLDFTEFLNAELATEPDEETRLLVQELVRKGGRVIADDPDDPAILVPSRNDAPVPIAPSRREGTAINDSLPVVASKEIQQPAALDLTVSQRRQVSILACGLVPAIQNSCILDPEDMGLLFENFRRKAEDVASRFGGYVAPTSVDVVHIYFGYPTTHEDDAVQAVRAGMAIVDSAVGMGALGEAGMAARAGIATGLVVIANDKGTEGMGRPVAIGEAPARASGMQAIAAPGHVVLSQHTRLLLGHSFDLRAIDVSGTEKHADQPAAWQVCNERGSISRRKEKGQERLAPLVGRQEEIDLVLRRWEQAKTGTGRVILVSGEPGIGKSHVAEDLLGKLDVEGSEQLRYFCSRHHSIRPLYPFVSLIEWSVGASSGRSLADKYKTLKALIGPHSSDPERDIALMSEILMLPADERYPVPLGTPAQKREMVLSAYLDWFESLVAQGPIAILFEDIHWIDPTSLDLLDRMIARISRLPVLIIVTMRPEHQPIWIGQPHVTMLNLNRLDRHDSSALVAGITRNTPFPDKVIGQIVDHADGVPLFVSELTKHLIERVLAGNIAAVEVFERLPYMPTTLQSSLIARLDRLGEFKEVAMVGSAIGREFSHALMASVMELEPVGLTAALERMMVSGLISRRGTPPNASYSFTHILMCDAAYGMMPKDQRRKLHSKIADELTRHASAHPESSAETVAHHLSSAGRTAEAIQYWVDASRAARKRWANRESADFLDLALEGLKKLPQSRETLLKAIDLRFEMKNALTPLGEFNQVIDYLLEAKALIDKLDDPTRLCQFQLHMCHSLGLGGKSKEAVKFGEVACSLAEPLDDSRLLVEATLLLGSACFTITDYSKAERMFLNVLELLDGEQLGQPFVAMQNPEVTAHSYLTKVKAVQGDYERGIAHGREAVNRAESAKEPYGMSVAYWCLAELYLARGDIAPAVDLLETGLRLARQHDFPFMVAAHNGSLGYAYGLTDRTDEGLPLLEQAVAVFDKMNHQLGLSLFLVPLGQVSVLAGHLEQARRSARRALDLAEETGHRSGEAGALHILAEVAARGGYSEQARQQYTSALDLAEKLEMRPLAAHCHHGLGEIQLRMAELDKARESLRVASKLYKEMAMWFWLEKVDVKILE